MQFLMAFDKLLLLTYLNLEMINLMLFFGGCKSFPAYILKTKIQFTINNAYSHNVHNPKY